MAAAAAAAGVPRGGLVSLAVGCAFMAGLMWVMMASHMGRAVDLCLAECGSVWPGECLLIIKCPSAVAAVSLVLTFWLWRREARAEAEAKAAGGGGAPDPELALALGPVSRRLRDSDAMATEIIHVIGACCASATILGLVTFLAGAWLGMQSGAQKGADALVEFGYIFSLVGSFSFVVELFCLILPFRELLQRRLDLENGAGYLPA